MKKKTSKVILIVFVTIISIYFLTACVYNFLFCSKYEDVNNALDYLEETPTKLFYTGDKLKGTLTPKQKQLASFTYVKGNYTFVEDDENIYYVLIFNQVDFGNSKDEMYFKNFEKEENMQLQYIFYRCKNEETFLKDNIVFNDYTHEKIEEGHDRGMFSVCFPYVELNKTRVEFDNLSVSFVSPRLYAKNDIVILLSNIIKTINQSIKNILPI